MQKLILRHGDCVDVLKGYEDASIGAVISDPPYHISFMGKSWDAGEAKPCCCFTGIHPSSRH